MAELPHLENPEQGFLGTANNRTVDDKYPYRISNGWVPDERIDRIKEVLGKTDKATVQSIKDLQFDRKSLFAGKLQKFLFADDFKIDLNMAIDSLSDKKKIENAKEALDFISPENFGGEISPESASAAVYEAFLFCLDRNFVFDEISTDYPLTKFRR